MDQTDAVIIGSGINGLVAAALPMLVGGLYLVATATRRRVRVEATAGSASVA